MGVRPESLISIGWRCVSFDAILWVMKNSETTLGARLVLLVLAEYAHEDGTKAFPMVESIAGKARMSRKGVQLALRRLERDGHIVKTGATKSGTNVYSINGMGAVDNPGETGDDRGVATSLRGVASTPDPLDKPVDRKELVVGLASTWGKAGLSKHRDAYYEKPKVQTSIRNALKVYPAADVAAAIENYGKVVASSDHFFSYRWTFQEFLDRGLDKFVAEADPLSNFRVRRDADAQGQRQRTPVEQLQSAEAWILRTAWRLPLDEHEVAEQLGQRGVEGPDRARLVELWRSKRAA